MKLFDGRNGRNANALGGAYAYTATGGQALHVWDPDQLGEVGRMFLRKAPSVFKRSRPWGHLFDMDKVRLERTARALGVRVIVIDRGNTVKQHIDLCGEPLRRAADLCLRSK